MNKLSAVGHPTVILFGNEKGGTGKSTLAMHLAVLLLNRGFMVATVDLDSRQGTFTRYTGNRAAYAARYGGNILLSTHHIVSPSMTPEEGKLEFNKVLDELAGYDIAIIDTPGHDSALSHFAHSYADVIVTPINDSLIDIDVLGVVDPIKQTVLRPSHYAERIWKARQEKARRCGSSIDWIVVRNRMSQLHARNKRFVGSLLDNLAKRIGFRVADGIAESVIYRELFLDGFTVEDIAALNERGKLSVSHVAARQELSSLAMALGLQSRLEKAHGSFGGKVDLEGGTRIGPFK